MKMRIIIKKQFIVHDLFFNKIYTFASSLQLIIKAELLPDSVIGNTSWSDREDSWFEPLSGNKATLLRGFLHTRVKSLSRQKERNTCRAIKIITNILVTLCFLRQLCVIPFKYQNDL